jgi:hypothetical protein
VVCILHLSVLACATNKAMTLDPHILLSLRTQALLCYASTRSLYLNPSSLDRFFEETRKVLIRYGRHAEQLKYDHSRNNDSIKGAFHSILATLQKKGVRGEGKGWVELCEVVLNAAQRVEYCLLPLSGDPLAYVGL